jgi:5-methylcytosine-specific restriction endonuclease McrA
VNNETKISRWRRFYIRHAEKLRAKSIKYYNTHKKEAHLKYKKHMKNNREVFLLSHYVAFDKKRGFECTLTRDFIKNIILTGSCLYCGEKDHLKLGVDRINPSLGHTIENSLTACSFCNRIRSNFFTVDQMKEIGEIIKKWKDEKISCE